MSINDTQLRSINTGDPRYASVISENFNVIYRGINSNAIGSDNYGLSNVQGSKIGNNAILNKHFSNSVIQRADISAGSPVASYRKLNQNGQGGGVLQVHAAGATSLTFTSSDAGFRIARYIQTYTIANSSETISLVFTLSSAIDGNPGFTVQPHPIDVRLYNTQSSHYPLADHHASKVVVGARNSSTFVVWLMHESGVGTNTDAATCTFTAHFAVMGKHDI